MFDVVEAAGKRHRELRGELTRIDDFLSYAERLVREALQNTRVAPASAASSVENKMPPAETQSEASSTPNSTPGAQEKPQPAEAARTHERRPLFRGATAGL